MTVPKELQPLVRNRAAQLGVKPSSVVRAALQKWLWQISEDEAAACEDTELMEAWKRKHDAELARSLLRGTR